MKIIISFSFGAVFTSDFARRPVVELEKILTFLGVKASREDLLTAVNGDAETVKEVFSEAPRLLAERILTPALAASIASAIENEMKISKELTRWPCKFFRDLEKQKDLYVLPIPAKDLAANCTGNYVTCSVQYDFQGG